MDANSEFEELCGAVCRDLKVTPRADDADGGTSANATLERDVRSLHDFCARSDLALSEQQLNTLQTIMTDCVDVVRSDATRPDAARLRELLDAFCHSLTMKTAKPRSASSYEDEYRARLYRVAEAPVEWDASNCPMPDTKTLETDIRRALRPLFDKNFTSGLFRISLDHKTLCEDMSRRKGVDRASTVCAWDDAEWRVLRGAASEREMKVAILEDADGNFMFELPARLYPANAEHRAYVLYHGFFVGSEARTRGLCSAHDPRADVLPFLMHQMVASRPHKLCFAEVVRTEALRAFSTGGVASPSLKKGFLLS